MEIDVKREDEILYIIINGDIQDRQAEEKLSSILFDIRSTGYIEHVIFNMSKAENITSNAIGILLRFFQIINKQHGSMEIKGISDKLYDQFMDIRLDTIFPITRKNECEK